MTSTIRVAAIQCALGAPEPETNIERIATLVREAASQGAQIILPPELFAGTYFPQAESPVFFERAFPVEKSPEVKRLRSLAAELDVAIPISFFEREGQAYYNSVAMVDGEAFLGVYRKTHIPDGPAYEEKYYFRPGDTGFQVWNTRFGNVGVGICWDQWFPEAARSMALMDAEVLLYPTAIGSEPSEPENDTREPWRRAMVGHAVCNAIPVIASNRIGREGEIEFYGSSFIASPRGDLVESFGREDEGVLVHTFDRAEMREERASWGFFRDRRPELYGRLLKP